MPDQQGLSKLLKPDVALAFAAIGIICILLVPLATPLLSGLIVLNFTGAFLMLLIVFYLEKPLELSAFPSVLLMTTFYRLSLNVASTKLILTQADAGRVIDAFGHFVIQNNYIIGAVIFLIMVIIQFIVITKGAERIAEVSARFTLDAMPGKQMSIDADLNAGLIDDIEAKERREELNSEAEFYGSMDGASKFIRGDAIAGLIITGVNIVGGLLIGVWQNDMSALEAVQRYTVLTIGDGLVSQLPALIMATSAGFLVSKSGEKENLSNSFSRQLLGRSEPFLMASAMLVLIGIVPGMPGWPFFVLSAVGGFVGYRLRTKGYLFTPEPVPAGAGGTGGGGSAEGGALPPGESKGSLGPGASGEEEEGGLEKLPLVTPMTLEIGFALVPLVDQERDGDLVNRIGKIREEIKEELGVVIPPISIQDNIELPNNEYRVMVRGLEQARGEVQVNQQLAINPGDVTGDIEGVKTKDPAFGFDAIWINPQRADAAEAMGYTVVDAPSVVTTHVTKVVKEHASELLSRQDVSDMVDKVKEVHNAVVDELIPNQLSVGTVHRVLQQLLKENVPIHDLANILETLSDYGAQTKDPVTLAEFCRQTLSGHIISQYVAETGALFSMILDPEVEEELQQSVTQGPGGGDLALAPQRASELTDNVVENFNTMRDEFDADIVLLVSPVIRPHIFRLIARKTKELPVLSYAEISDNVDLKVVASIKGEPQNAAPETAAQETTSEPVT